MNASAMARNGRAGAERAARGSVTKTAAKAGFAARGVIYLLVGLLALQIAFGDTKEEADRRGALAAGAGAVGFCEIRGDFGRGRNERERHGAQRPCRSGTGGTRLGDEDSRQGRVRRPRRDLSAGRAVGPADRLR
ncbi:DUF1206 domain-containing protein [Streptomyces sp. LUP30]|uniref:DUF1206 domain-containing protein n=1 Tax=Streptomyces sp. LUP30 TaxID=1890285 RepID=UPI0009A01058